MSERSAAAAFAPPFAAGIVFLVCAWHAAPVSYWLDSSELVAAAQELGVAHPPGHPLHAVTAKAAALLPLGSIPFRVHLHSAACLAAAAALMTFLLSWLGRAVFGWRSGARDVFAAGCAVAVCLSYGAAFQAVRAEVYTLHFAAMLTITLGCIRFGEKEAAASAKPDLRVVLVLAFVAGLALANHHYLVVLGGAPLLVYLAWRGGRAMARRLGVCAAAICLGLAAYVYLPVRANAAPVVSWGDAVNAERFGWVVSARAFQKSLRPREHTSVADNAITAAGVVMDAVTPVGAALGLVGLALVLRRRRALGAALSGAMLLTLASQLTMPADPANPDVHGYLLFAGALLTLGAFALVARVASFLADGRAWRWVATSVCALAAALPAAQSWAHLDRFSLRSFYDTEIAVRPILRDAPASAVVFTSYFQSVFLAWEARVVEGERPDVAHVHRHFLRYPGFAAREASRHRGLAKVFERYAASGRFEPGDLEAIARERPVRVEPDLDLHAHVLRTLRPEGFLSAPAEPPPEDAPAEDAASNAYLAFWERGPPAMLARSPFDETRRFLLWKHYVGAVAALGRRFGRAASFHVRRGLEIAPRSPELLDLERKIDPPPRVR